MNKDVIYIEPEDDITDIISKIESSKEKIIALIPPKKSSILRSVVNIKLITKTGISNGKNIVLVTTDPSIIKIAAAVKIPVTKNLQTAPAVPTEENISEETTIEEVVEEESVIKVTDSTKEESDKVEVEEKESKSEDKNDDSEDKDDKKNQKEKEPAAKKVIDNKILAWIVEYKKWVIAGASAFFVLILILIWAFAIAPAVEISLKIRTDSGNFSELVNFVTDQTKEDSEAGTFYITEIKEEAEESTEAIATGTKNVGEKAKGELIIYTYLGYENETTKESVTVNAGTAFKSDGLVYYSDTDTILAWNSGEDCENKNNLEEVVMHGCLKSAKITITAAEPGAKYNIDGTASWIPAANVAAYISTAPKGGSDKTITVLTEDDVKKAKEEILARTKANEDEIKEDLKENVKDGMMVIDSSFKQKASDPIVEPKIGEEIKEGTTPSVKIKFTRTIFTIDETKVKEFITEKAKINENQKIYTINNPFIENFVATKEGYSGKLKTSYKYGSRITDEEILEIVKGKGIGDIQHSLKSLGNISDIKIEKSVPWVNSAPNDTNKITINIIVDEDKAN